MARGAGFVQRDSGRRSGICPQSGPTKLYPPLFSSVSVTDISLLKSLLSFTLLYTLSSINVHLPLFSCWCRKSTVWVWLKGSEGEGSDQAGVVEPVDAAWWAGVSQNRGVCTQMALGSQGQWRKVPCAGRHLFLCEKDVTGETQTVSMDTRLQKCVDDVILVHLLIPLHAESLPSVDSYLTGSVLMTGIYAQTPIHPIPNVPDIGQLPVEVSLKH